MGSGYFPVSIFIVLTPSIGGSLKVPAHIPLLWCWRPKHASSPWGNCGNQTPRVKYLPGLAALSVVDDPALRAGKWWVGARYMLTSSPGNRPPELSPSFTPHSWVTSKRLLNFLNLTLLTCKPGYLDLLTGLLSDLNTLA